LIDSHHRIKKSIIDDLETMAYDIREEHFCSLNKNKMEDPIDCYQTQSQHQPKDALKVGGGTLSRAQEPPQDSKSSTSLQSCYYNVAEMRRMTLEASMFSQRMRSVSLNLQAEYDALRSSLCLGLSYSRDKPGGRREGFLYAR
jgi:hypothetical protein